MYDMWTTHKLAIKSLPTPLWYIPGIPRWHSNSIPLSLRCQGSRKTSRSAGLPAISSRGAARWRRRLVEAWWTRAVQMRIVKKTAVVRVHWFNNALVSSSFGMAVVDERIIPSFPSLLIQWCLCYRETPKTLSIATVHRHFSNKSHSS